MHPYDSETIAQHSNYVLIFLTGAARNLIFIRNLIVHLIISAGNISQPVDPTHIAGLALGPRPPSGPTAVQNCTRLNPQELKILSPAYLTDAVPGFSADVIGRLIVEDTQAQRSTGFQRDTIAGLI